MLRHILLPALAAIGLAACYGEGSASYGYSTAPSYAYVSPGVSVIADYDYPVFYSDNYYWRWNNGYWYRSPYYDRGWTYTYTVPEHIRRIDRPWAYRHYHRGVVARRPLVRDHRRY